MSKKIMSSGYGESKLTSTMPAEEVEALNQKSHSGIPPRAVWTVNGIPVNEAVDGDKITFEMTDQFLADCVRKKQAKIEAGWPEEVVNGRLKGEDNMPPQLRQMFDQSGRRDEADKQVEAMADRMLNFDASVFDADPLEIIASRYKNSGKAPYWGKESDADMDRMRGFSPVLNDKGEPVTHGEMRLLERPIEIQKMELRAVQARGQEQIAATIAADEESQAKHFRGDLGLPTAPSSVLQIGLGLSNDTSDFG